MTDVEGSTAPWVKSGAAFQRALESHHALLRAQFLAHHGHKVKEAGDSFLVAFEFSTSAHRIIA